MWTDGLRLDDIQDCKPKQRVDQCMHGAVDELQYPIQKETGLGANIKFNKAALRCNGHRRQPHAHLRGQGPIGVNQTAARSCLSEADVSEASDGRYQVPLQAEPHKHQNRELLRVRQMSTRTLYCPRSIDHTLIPGQCRHGRYAEEQIPGRSCRRNLPIPSKDWKKNANKETFDGVTIDNKLVKEPDVQSSRYLKKLLVETVNGTLTGSTTRSTLLSTKRSSRRPCR